MSLQLDHTPTAPTAPSRWSWRLGAPFGIETRVHVSFVLVLLYVGWSTWSSAGGSPLVVGLSLAFTLALFGCVLLHELGHALTARRFGIGTYGITLSPIGGVAQLKSMPKTPKQELLIAIAGPAVNVAIAGLLYGVLYLVALAGPLSAPLAIAAYLGSLLLYANLALGVFNMIPAFPMDGGRVLRAGLELRMGRLRATEIAANVAKVFAVAFAIYGVFYNSLLVLIAAFVWFAGQRELRMVQLIDEMRRKGVEVHFTTAPPRNFSSGFAGHFASPFSRTPPMHGQATYHAPPPTSQSQTPPSSGPSARPGPTFERRRTAATQPGPHGAPRRTPLQVIVDPGPRA